MSKAPTPAPKSGEPIGAYRAQGDRFAAFDATGRAWLVDQATAERLGIREPDPALFPPLKARRAQA